MNNVWYIDLLDLKDFQSLFLEVDYDPGTRSGGQQLALSSGGPAHCALCGIINAQPAYFAFGYRQGEPESPVGWEARVCQDCGKQGKDAVETALARVLIAEYPGAVVQPGPMPEGWSHCDEPSGLCMVDVGGDGDDEVPF